MIGGTVSGNMVSGSLRGLGGGVDARECEPELSRFIDRLSEVAGRLSDQRDRLMMVADRLYGPIPVAAGKGDHAPPAGSIGQIDLMIDMILGRITEVGEQADRLRSL